MSDSGDELEKQLSYDKRKCKLKGVALSSKKKKMISELPEDEDRVDTEDLKSLPSNVYITEVKRRSRRASDLKKKIKRDLLRLSVECGYAVQLNCIGPKPASGPPGAPLKLNLCDVNGLKTRCSCRKVKPPDCECQFKRRFNVGIQTPDKIPSSANIPPECKKLTPSKSRNLESREKIGNSLVSPICGSKLSTMTSDDDFDDMDETNQFNAEAEEESSDQMETETLHENNEKQNIPSSSETGEGKQKPTQMNQPKKSAKSEPPQKKNLQLHVRSKPTPMKSPQHRDKPETQINPDLSSKLKSMQTNPQQTKPSNPSQICTKQTQSSSSSQMNASFLRPYESNGLALPLKPLPVVKRSGHNSKQSATKGSFFPPTRVDPNVKLGMMVI